MNDERKSWTKEQWKKQMNGSRIDINPQKIITEIRKLFITSAEKELRAKKALEMAHSIQDKSFHRGRVYELEDIVKSLIDILGE